MPPSDISVFHVDIGRMIMVNMMGVEGIVNAIKFYLEEELNNPTEHNCLVLYVVADDGLNKILNAKEGKLSITIRALPTTLAEIANGSTS